MAPPPVKRTKDEITYLVAGTASDATEIVFRIFPRSTSMKTNFYTYPGFRNGRYDKVQNWAPAFLPKASQKKAHMKAVTAIWDREVGKLELKPSPKNPTIPITPTTPTPPSRTPGSASSPIMPGVGSVTRKRTKKGDEQLFWTPTANGDALHKHQTNRIGKLIKSAGGLKAAPPHEVIQAMVTYQFVVGEKDTPFAAPEWLEWLQASEDSELPMEWPTELERLFRNPEEEDSNEWIDTETEEAKRKILGHQLYDELAKYEVNKAISL